MSNQYRDEPGTRTHRKYLEAALDHLKRNLTVPQWAVSVLEAAAQPVDMILFCPMCNTQHIDAPDPDVYDTAKNCAAVRKGYVMGGALRPKEWTNPPHRTHLCGGCGWMWRPSDVATNGVLHLASGHRFEMKAPQWEMMAAKRYQETHIDPPWIVRYVDRPYPNSIGELTKTERAYPCCCTIVNREKSQLPTFCPLHGTPP